MKESIDLIKNINILYVEDEQSVAEVIQGMLDKVTNITLATNGVEGLKIYMEHNKEITEGCKPFDLIITDINMPKLNGIEMIKKIREVQKEIPIIITSAHNETEFLQEAIKLKVRDYINKPINIQELIIQIVTAIEPMVLKNEIIKHNKELQNRIDEKTEEFKTVVDSQENMIMVIQEGKIKTMNKKLKEFFDVKDIRVFQEDFGCVCKFFKKEKGYFSQEENLIDSNWVKSILELPDKERIVKMKSAKEETKVFQINAAKFFYEGEQFVISFTDITDLKKYNEKLHYQATHDNLTKLYNRQKVNLNIEEEMERTNRYNGVFSIILLDIDHFKTVNDTHGHDIGDVVLKQVSKILKNCVRKTDMVARWGGEEFLILLPYTDKENTLIIANKLRREIEAHTYKEIGDSVTVSLGIKEYENKKTKEDLLKKVDLALYKAKDNGRNQSIIFEDYLLEEDAN